MSYPMSFIISKRKETIVKRLTAAIILGLVSLLIAPYPAVAQSPETTASEVVDQETLKAFVEEARAWSETITDPNDVAPYTVTISVEGDWKHGNTYLILMLPNGTVFFHAGDASANGKNLYDIEDSHGNKVVQDLIAAAGAGGGFVEYYWDDPAVEGDQDTPKTACATSYISGMTGTPVILIGGYYQDLSQASLPSIDPSVIPIPEVTAADVVDRETLKAFVQGTLESYLTAIEQIGLEQLLQHQEVFREEGGPWRQGSIYFFCFATNGYVLFHGVARSREHTDATEREDVNGVKFIQDLIKVAKAGGGYVEYYYNDPAVEGDEDTGSPKVGYAELFTFRDQEYVIGAGFYTKSVTATAVEGPSWGQLKSRF